MPLSDKVQKDLHLLYNATNEDIRFAKSQKWRITYYTILLMGGLTYLKVTHIPHSWLADIPLLSKIPLLGNVYNLSIIVLAILTVYLIQSIESDIRNKYRPKIKEITARLTVTFKKTHTIDPHYLRIRYNWLYSAVLSLTVIVAAFLLFLIPPKTANLMNDAQRSSPKDQAIELLESKSLPHHKQCFP